MDASISGATSAALAPIGPTAGLHHAGNIRFLALTALGVVFGDIGTSPLYTFRSVALGATGHAIPTCSGLSHLIFWAPMAMVSLKYVVFVVDYSADRILSKF